MTTMRPMTRRREIATKKSSKMSRTSAGRSSYAVPVEGKDWKKENMGTTSIMRSESMRRKSAKRCVGLCSLKSIREVNQSVSHKYLDRFMEGFNKKTDG